MSFFSRFKRAPTLSEEFVERYWDLKARLDHLEAHVDDELASIRSKYNSVAQVERRLDQKRAEGEPCEEGMTPGQVRDSVFDIARRAQHGSA